MKKTPKPVSDYYAELGRKSAKARAKKIIAARQSDIIPINRKEEAFNSRSEVVT